jgi:hypothetical protein
MRSTHDSFSERFDSIDVGGAALAPTAGFFLIDDAGGRFQIDREMGVVSLKDESLLERERFAIHVARVRVVESTGESYEMELKLRLTGIVPEMVGAENALFDIGGATDAATATAPVIAAAPVCETAPALAPAPIPRSWTLYAVAHARAGKGELARTRRAFIAADMPAFAPTHADASLQICAPLPPVGLQGDWSL